MSRRPIDEQTGAPTSCEHRGQAVRGSCPEVFRMKVRRRWRRGRERCSSVLAGSPCSTRSRAASCKRQSARFRMEQARKCTHSIKALSCRMEEIMTGSKCTFIHSEAQSCHMKELDNSSQHVLSLLFWRASTDT
ncbi:unnamed protein product, partial [Amoebophrya sp. A120]|eukprot:GSA120T00005442001.1